MGCTVDTVAVCDVIRVVLLLLSGVVNGTGLSADRTSGLVTGIS